MATSIPTLDEYLRYWLREVVAPNLTPGTYVTYEAIVRLYISPGLGGRRLDRLQSRDVQTWLNSVGRTCQCCAQGKDARRPVIKQCCCALGRCCQDLPSASSIRHLRRILRTVLSHAIAEDLITRNAASNVKLPPIRTHKRKSWQTDEARLFLESARTEADPMYVAYVLVLVLGLRKGEVLGLAWDDIDWNGWDRECPAHGEAFCDACRDCYSVVVDIAWQLQRVGRHLLRRQTKTDASDAPLPLPAICLVALRSRWHQQQDSRVAAGPAWQDTGLIVTTRYGTPIEPRNFTRFWDRRCAAAEVRRITVHDARRTCGSLLADLDVHPRTAMQILRHAQFAITMEIYTQVSSKATRDALKRLGESLDP